MVGEVRSKMQRIQESSVAGGRRRGMAANDNYVYVTVCFGHIGFDDRSVKSSVCVSRAQSSSDFGLVARTHTVVDSSVSHHLLMMDWSNWLARCVPGVTQRSLERNSEL